MDAEVPEQKPEAAPLEASPGNGMDPSLNNNNKKDEKETSEEKCVPPTQEGHR